MHSAGQAFATRSFKYGMVWPAVLVILLIGLFPIIYTLIVSFQNIDMFAEDTRFSGFIHYGDLFRVQDLGAQIFRGDTLLWDIDHPAALQHFTVYPGNEIGVIFGKDVMAIPPHDVFLR